MAHLILQYETLVCFFLSFASILEVHFTTDSLSQKTLAGPEIGIPNIRNLYLRASTCSVAILSAIILDEKVEVSTVFCLLEYQLTGHWLQKIMMPE